MSGPTWEMVEKLQAALNFWLPCMGQVGEEWNDRIADDADLLMGYVGQDVNAPTFYDLLSDTRYTLTPAGKAHLEGKK